MRVWPASKIETRVVWAENYSDIACVALHNHLNEPCLLFTYEEILDISLFFTLILTFSCCSLSMANTGDEVIYFDFVNFYKKRVGEILILHAICLKMIPIQL